ncbi:hypothetical protein R2F61_04800 [Mollicutes bacterium LVI A0078]|nr:hypothetical protein RZE84_04820 [Mollicutes bacterium LVI A0075]WOO91863.1 hypothetical protein R2F61_04800 [Mollicutes bacterium LVI A0078]
MTNLHYKIILNNNVEYVFDKLFAKAEYKEWTRVFNPSSDYDGILGLGEEIFLKDAENNGMLSKVSKYEVNKVIEFSYLASVEDGVKTEFEDRSNFERYTFTSLQDEMVMIDVDLNIPDEYLEMFEDMWAQAIVLIQDLFDNDEDESLK